MPLPRQGIKWPKPRLLSLVERPDLAQGNEPRLYYIFSIL
jgi:hypothetical protein